MSDGCCPNCEEELFIFETQSEYLPLPLSTGFTANVVSQEIARAKRIWITDPADGVLRLAKYDPQK